jgi:hypothetical protein
MTGSGAAHASWEPYDNETKNANTGIGELEDSGALDWEASREEESRVVGGASTWSLSTSTVRGAAVARFVHLKGLPTSTTQNWGGRVGVRQACINLHEKRKALLTWRRAMVKNMHGHGNK